MRDRLCSRLAGCAVELRGAEHERQALLFFPMLSFLPPLVYADMQGRVARAEAESSSAAPPIADARAQLTALEDQKARLVEDVQRLRRTKEVSQAALQALTQQIAAIKQAKASLNSDHGSNVPRVRCVLLLQDGRARRDAGDALPFLLTRAPAYRSAAPCRRAQALSESLRIHLEHPMGLRLGRSRWLCVSGRFPSVWRGGEREREAGLHDELCCPQSFSFVLSARLSSRADVAPPHGAPVKPFPLDPKALSEKAIADALWASIGEAYGLGGA